MATKTRFPHDYPYFREYARLMKLAVPASLAGEVSSSAPTPVGPWRGNSANSAGVINFWVCGGGMFGWYDEAAKHLKKPRRHRLDLRRHSAGDRAASAHITTDVLRPWIYGVDGFVRWQTTRPGAIPGSQFEGGRETTRLSGRPLRGQRAPRFDPPQGAAQRHSGPRAAELTSRGPDPSRELRAEAARRFNNTSVEEWWTPRPPLADTNPEDWSNATIDEAMPQRTRSLRRPGCRRMAACPRLCSATAREAR